MDADCNDQDARGDVEPRKRRYITVHCPSGKPGPPYEILAVHGRTPLASFATLAEAESFAAREAHEGGASVVLSPLARGEM